MAGTGTIVEFLTRLIRLPRRPRSGFRERELSIRGNYQIRGSSGRLGAGTSALAVWMRNLLGTCDDLQGSGKRVWIGRFGAFVRQLRFGGEALAQDAVG